MITSHRDRRAFQNYGYFSRSCPIRHMKSLMRAIKLFAQHTAQCARFAGHSSGRQHFCLEFSDIASRPIDAQTIHLVFS
jgi:hypothetical protein